VNKPIKTKYIAKKCTLPFKINFTRIFNATIPKNRALINPTSDGISSSSAKFDTSKKNLTTEMPNIVGMDNKNENLIATDVSTPLTIPLDIVTPLLEIPGIIAIP